MKNEVWKPSWSDLWAKLEPGQVRPKENLDFWLHIGGVLETLGALWTLAPLLEALGGSVALLIYLDAPSSMLKSGN